MIYYLLPWKDPRVEDLPEVLDTSVNGNHLLLNRKLMNLLPAGHYVVFAISGNKMDINNVSQLTSELSLGPLNYITRVLPSI